jgi:hypothetical protein
VIGGFLSLVHDHAARLARPAPLQSVTRGFAVLATDRKACSRVNRLGALTETVAN